jgi:NAD(P)-dependent dehydrogenase (short-subunit alcohol dehydrogenase family)
VVITGSSTGIGRACGLHLDSLGFRVLTADRPRTRYLVSRRAKVMAALARFLPDRALDRMIARATGS